jgi:glucose/arabinose dehydrogenase
MYTDQDRTQWRWLLAMALLLAGGCIGQPVVLPPRDQVAIDRTLMEYPPGFVVKPLMVNLTAPTALCFDSQGTMFVAEGGGTKDDLEPHIFGYRPGAPASQQLFDVYPVGRRIPFVPTGFQIKGPVGGMVAVGGKLFVTHQDGTGNGVVTAFGYDGSHTPVVSDIPARGDYKMGDISVDQNGRLYFTVGAATNSAVVGLDNWDAGWVRDHPEFCDVPYLPLKLQGYRFNSDNPLAGLFSGAAIAVTGPFQAFNVGDNLHIPRPANGKPTGAIYSISQSGGDLRVEAWGVRWPRGIICGDFHRVYFTDDGMEPRGTRPVLNDPDAVFQLFRRGFTATWYGWPDYSRELEPIGTDKYQPPPQLLRDTGYHEISALIDEQNTALAMPDKTNWLKGTFLSQAGAAKLDIVPSDGAFKEYRGGVIVALFGDHAPFSTGGPDGLALSRVTGYKVVRVDLVTKEVTDFVYNTRLGPASALGTQGRGLERPIDVKFGPDGALYILDYGQMVMKDGKESISRGTGRIWRVLPAN